MGDDYISNCPYMIRRTNEVITRVPMGNGGRLGVLDADQRMQCCKRTKKKLVTIALLITNVNELAIAYV